MAADAVLTMEARLMDHISKNIDRINQNITRMTGQGKSKVSALESAWDKLTKAASRPIGNGGGIFKELLKFAGVQKIMNMLEQSIFKVFEAATKNSPKLAGMFEQLKGKANSLFTEIAEKATPMLIKAMDFIIKNWDKVRFAFILGGSAISDAFFSLIGVFQMASSGFLNAGAMILGGLAKLGLASQDTADKWDKASTSMAEKAVANFGKVGKTVATLKGGLDGIGKYTKQTDGLFGDAPEKKTSTIDAQAAIRSRKMGAFLDLQRNNPAAAQGMEQDVVNKANAKLENEEKMKALEQLTKDRAAFEKELQAELSESKFATIQNDFLREEEMTEAHYQELLKQAQKLGMDKTKIDEMQTNQRIALARKEKQMKTEAAMDTASNLLSAATLVAGMNKKQGALLKALAMAEIGVNTARGIMAVTAAGIPGLVLAASIGVLGAAQAAKVAATPLKSGTPFFPGRDSLVRVNDGGGGQEALLNGRASNLLGVGRINELNNGKSPVYNVVNEIHYAPTNHITNSGGSTVSIVEALDRDKDNFFRWYGQQQKKGYK